MHNLIRFVRNINIGVATKQNNYFDAGMVFMTDMFLKRLIISIKRVEKAVKFVVILIFLMLVLTTFGCNYSDGLDEKSKAGESTGISNIYKHDSKIEVSDGLKSKFDSEAILEQITENSDINDKQKASENLFFNEPSIKPSQTFIKIFKNDRVLELYGDEELIGRFKIALGGHPKGDKNKEGDSRTPEGIYYICTRNPNSPFTLFMGISYPGIEDAKRGSDSDLIDNRTFEKIKEHINGKKQPPWNTALGGEVGIHGGGTSGDWTLGCIAVSDDDIRILWEYSPMGTAVEIKP